MENISVCLLHANSDVGRETIPEFAFWEIRSHKLVVSTS